MMVEWRSVVRSGLLGLVMSVSAVGLAGQQVAATDGADPGVDLFEVLHHQPFQRAILETGWGEVEFKISCVRQETQQMFAQGLAQLHTHAYLEAERSFRRVVVDEPDCAMGYWGMAMANVHNPDRASMFLDTAVLHRVRTVAVERQFLDALLRFYEIDLAAAQQRNQALAEQKGWPVIPKRKFERRFEVRAAGLVEDYQTVLAQHPRHLEAMALLGNRLALNLRRGVGEVSAEQIDALLARLLRLNRRHPAHFYRMKLWELRDPRRAAKALPFVMVTAPSSRNAWHLTARVQARLGRHQAAATYFEAALRVDHARMARHHAMPYQVHGYGRNVGQLCESLWYLGRARQALVFARYMLELPRHPRSNQLANPDSIAHRGAVQLARVCQAWGLDVAAQVKGLDATAQAVVAAVVNPFATVDARLAAGQGVAALELLARLPLQDSTAVRARRIRGLHAVGKLDQVSQEFSELRRGLGLADRDLPLLQALAPIAAKLGLPVDWRQPPTTRPELWPGQELAQLGPEFWRPWLPRAFDLVSHQGRRVRSAELRGRAQVVVFFIGNGCCLTCVAQLHLFNTLADEFKQADIDIAAISFHSDADVRASMAKMGEQGFPFLLLSDPQMRTWYEWLTIDRHDHSPLHGTFLLDERGRVRWQEINDRPFEDPGWLLAEARRLLGR